jgi:hypothetical protein
MKRLLIRMKRTSAFEGISVASGEGNIRNGQSSVDSSTMREKIESDPVNDNLNW